MRLLILQSCPINDDVRTGTGGGAGNAGDEEDDEQGDHHGVVECFILCHSYCVCVTC